MQRTKANTLIVSALAILAAPASLLLPVPARNAWLPFHMALGLAVVVTVLFIGASAIYVSSFTNFTPQLKRAYGLLCVGFSVLGISFLQLPLVIYAGGADSLWRQSGLIAVPFVVSLVAIFGGTRAFAHLFGVRSLTTRWWFAIVPGLVLALLVSRLPHVPVNASEISFDGQNAFTVVTAWIDLMAMLNVLQVKKIASAQYANALAWLTISFGFMLSGVIGTLLIAYLVGDNQWFLTGSAPLIPLALEGVALLRSAYVFNIITRQGSALGFTTFTPRTFFGKPRQPVTPVRLSSIDIVIFTANLVSKPHEINTTLDNLRAITARADLRQGAALTDKDNAELERIYLELEDYLVKKERVRAFTKESLRQTVANGLFVTSAKNTFWEKLPT